MATTPSARGVAGLSGLLLCGALLVPSSSRAGDPAAAAGSGTEQAAPRRAAASAGPSRTATHRPVRLSKRATEFYQAAWGVDRLKVSRAASGNLIRFTYRVTDAEQAAALFDRKATPQLYAPRTHALLSIPVMEKIGPLRQTGEVKVGQEYWMTFSNKGQLVKPGDRVDVIIGQFHVNGLMVQ